MEKAPLPGPALASAEQPDTTVHSLDDEDSETPFDHHSVDLLHSNKIEEASLRESASLLPRSSLKEAELLPASTSTRTNGEKRTTQAPMPKDDSPAIDSISRLHNAQAVRPRPLSVISLPKASSMPSAAAVNTSGRVSSDPKLAKRSARHITPPGNSQSGPRNSTTPTGTRPPATQNGRGVTPAPTPTPTPTKTKTKRLSAPLGTRVVGSTSKGTPTYGNLPPTRSPTPRQAVKASGAQPTASGRPSVVQDAVRTLNTQHTASSKLSATQASSKQLGTMSSKHSVVQAASSRLATQTATPVVTRPPGKVPSRQPTPTAPRTGTVIQETTAKLERGAATRVATKVVVGQRAVTPSGRLSATQEQTPDKRRVRDSDRLCGNRVSTYNSRSLTRAQGKQLQMQIPSSTQPPHGRPPITPVSATSTVPPKLPFLITPAPTITSHQPPVTPATRTDLSKLPPTPTSLTASRKPPTTPAAVTTVSRLPLTPASPSSRLKSPDTPASSQAAVFQTVSPSPRPGEGIKTSTQAKKPTSAIPSSQPLSAESHTHEAQTSQPRDDREKPTSPYPDVQVNFEVESPSDLCAPPNTPTVRAPCNPHENYSIDAPAVPFHPLASGGLFICGDERRIPRKQTPQRSRSVGYAPPVRILRSPERAPVPLEYPPWDRTVEVTWERTLNNPPDKFTFDKELSFQQGVLRLRKERTLRDPDGVHNLNRKGLQDGKYPQLKGLGRLKRCLYFFLPDRARFEITNMILNHLHTGNQNPKPVRMNPPRYYEPIWPLHPLNGRKLWTTEYLDSLSSAISPLYPYMSVCYDMRADFLAAFFLARRFHVVYSPFVVEQHCPMATLFMDAYVPLMRYITLEVDYTKLGGNVNPTAVGVDQWRGLQRVHQLVAKFANLQCTRADGVNIGNLCLMVRRYYGYREGMKWKKGSAERRVRHDEPEPEEEGEGKCHTSTETSNDGQNDEKGETDDEELVPYHPDAYLCILDPLKLIGHRVDSLTVVGTTKGYANELIYAIWGKDEIPRGPGWKARIEKHRKYRTAGTFPFTPGQRSALTRSGSLQITRHMRDPRSWVGSYGCKLRPEIKIVESKLVPGETKYGFQWNDEPNCGPPGGVLTIVKLPSDKHLPNVVMKPAESPQRFSSMLLSRAFNRTPKGIRPPLSAPSSPLLNTTPVTATVPASGSASPSITKPSSLSQITFLGEESSDEGQHQEKQPPPNFQAHPMEDEGDDHWKRHFWKPSKIPLGSLIKKHAKSVTKKRSSNKLSEAASEHDSHSGAACVGSEDQKGTFGKLIKRASSNVLGKGFFGKRGIQTHRY
ncbi:hypothetical protein QBC40DRAFT_285606 [Triangularia verruculosa]|uniref:Uncharacterized protein n=1 Tax=Triangularia verruculosa TaxID=2587418 RepID=A0AAN6XD63_9PEZI|nr:hypothetical protein QBC40DRAFT_285606 [Triangularia verruculosa]